MNVLIIYAHPNPNSFCHAILETVADEVVALGHQCVVHDLYEMGFDPVLSGDDFVAMKAGTFEGDVLAEQEAIRKADKIVFIHPIWWMGMPAILKGWVDRVLSQGFAYRYTDKGVESLLPGKKILYFTTAGNSEASYEDRELDKAIATINTEGIFGFMGLEIDLDRRFYAVPSVTYEDRQAMLMVAKQDISIQI